MRFLVVTAALVAIVSGKPQYNYPSPSPAPIFQQPSGSYGTPGIGIGGGGSTGFISGGSSGSSSFISGGSGGSSGFVSGGGIGNTGFIGGGGGSSGFVSGGGGSSGGFVSGGGGGGGGFVSGGGGGTLVQKHIYVHVAPPEPEEFRQQRPISAGQATKHYKIIFIKAPSPPSYQAQNIQLANRNEEKTLVYVLVKRPDEQQDVNIQTAAPTQPSKPEVYFIRYKAKSEVSGGGTVGGGGAVGGGQLIGGGGIIGGGSGGVIGGGIGGGSGCGGGLGGAGGLGCGTGGSAGGISIATGGSSSVSTNYGPPGKSGPY